MVTKSMDSGARLCDPVQVTFPLRPSIYCLKIEQNESACFRGLRRVNDLIHFKSVWSST